MSQAGSQDDGEYEVIIVDENNSSILADHDVTSSGPPSTKVSKHPPPLLLPFPRQLDSIIILVITVIPFTKHVKRVHFVCARDAYIEINWSELFSGKKKERKKKKRKKVNKISPRRWAKVNEARKII